MPRHENAYGPMWSHHLAAGRAGGLCACRLPGRRGVRRRHPRRPRGARDRGHDPGRRGAGQPPRRRPHHARLPPPRARALPDAGRPGGAGVPPAITYALSHPDAGFTGVVHIRIPTFMSLIEDLCVSFAASGFKRVIFLNGHYDNTYAIAYACANAADRMPKDVKAFPVNYWDALAPDEVPEFSTLTTGLHANLAETSAVLRINADLVDMEKANAEFPPFPDYTLPTGPGNTAFFFTAPGSVYWATKSGTWGDARGSTAEIGERYLQAGVRSTLRLLESIEQTFAAMPPR